MRVAALIPTAGTGERFGANRPKPLVELCGKPVIAHTLAVFEATPCVDEIFLIVHPDFENDYAAVVAAGGFKKVRGCVPGGATRTQSVRNGLGALGRDVDYVIVHDGVRPLVTPDMIEAAVVLARDKQAVVTAVPVKPTLKVVDPATRMVRETLDRTLIWEIQTPQVFSRSLLVRAYDGEVDATDDAALVEQLGVTVSVCQGDYRNIKITTPEDLVIADAFMRKGF